MANILDQVQNNHSTWQGSIYSVRRRSQSFTTGAGVTNISQVKLWLQRVGSNEIARVRIYLSDTGGNDDKPTGGILGTSEDVSGISTSEAEVTFDFATPVTVLELTKYCAVIEYTDGNTSNYLKYFTDGVGLYANGKAAESNDSGSSYTVKTFDEYFKTYYTEVGPVDLKSVNTIARADIKSINGIAIADVKSVNGIT